MTEIIFVLVNIYITEYVRKVLFLLNTMDNFYNFIIIFKPLNTSSTHISFNIISY